jgi:hypothetical protein
MADSIEKQLPEGDASKELDTAPPGSAGLEETGSKINEKALLRKLDLRLLPPLTLLYLLSFLDRSNGK